MSVNTPKIISKESFLTYCYEQIINKSNLSEALQNIAHYAVQQLAVTYCQISIQSENEKQVFEAYQQNTTANAIENLKKINNEVVKLPLGIYQFNIKNASSEIKSFMHNAGVESILICPFSKNNFQEQFLLAASTPINWDDYLPVFQQLILAINNTILTKNTQKQLYHRNEIYETTLSVLNKLIWNYDLKTNTVKVTGYSPRTGNYIKEATYQYSELWQKETIHPDDIEKVNLHYQQFLLQKETNKSELVFRMKGKNDDEYIWIKVLQSILRDEQGNPTIIAGTIANLQDELDINLELKKNNEILLQQVQESNERLNTILNSSKEIILTIDLQTGQIENINNAVAVLGYTPEEWIGQYYTEWTLEKRKKFHDLLKHASKSTTSVKRKQIIFSTKDNKNKIPFEFSTSVFSFKEKKYLLCVLRDITERLEYEKNIEKVTNQLTHLINNIDDVYAIYNIAHKKYEFVSDNIESLYGYSKEDFISNGLFWKDIIHLEDYTSIVKQMEEVINNKGKGEFFYRITNAVGETKMLLEKITVALNKNGKAEKIYIVKSDYTHIENAEQNLIESERKFRFISENITDFISVLDNDGRFMYASPSAEKVIGYNSEELIGKNFIYIIHKDDAESFIENALEKIVFNKEEVKLRYRILTKTNKYYWVETYFKPIIDTTNQTTSIICSTRDVTEREQLMTDLQQALEKERELNELRSQFVSMASHQFRTPLTVIQSGVELMEIYLDGLQEEQQKPFKKQFKRINAEVTRLQDLMTDVLVLGREEAQRTPYTPEEDDLVIFCKDLIESRYNNRYPYGRKVILFVFGKEQKVLFDKKLLDHSLENILNNAYKYSETGDIKMTIHFEFEQVKISIKDNGIGIPQNDLTNLFQPFYRASNTIEIEGTGLGLPIVKEFIEKHGGSIFVESELNIGTTITVILPLINKPNLL